MLIGADFKTESERFIEDQLDLLEVLDQIEEYLWVVIELKWAEIILWVNHENWLLSFAILERRLKLDEAVLKEDDCSSWETLLIGCLYLAFVLLENLKTGFGSVWEVLLWGGQLNFD